MILLVLPFGALTWIRCSTLPRVSSSSLPLRAAAARVQMERQARQAPQEKTEHRERIASSLARLVQAARLAPKEHQGRQHRSYQVKMGNLAKTVLSLAHQELQAHPALLALRGQ